MTATPLSLRLSAAIVRAGNTVGDELFPILVWLTVFGVTRVAPSAILRLSMAVPQSMDVPRLLQWRRTTSASGLSADELSTRLADLINDTPSGSSSSNGYGAAALPDSPSWTRAQHRLSETLFSVFTYPQRLLTYALFRRDQQAALRSSREGGAAAEQLRSPLVVRLLLRLVTSFTATWVHASGNMLFDTVVTYLSTRLGSWSSGGGTAGFALGNGGPGRSSATRLNSGWRDLLVASCVSTGVNFVLQTYWLEALTSLGELRSLGSRRSGSSTTTHRTGGGGAGGIATVATGGGGSSAEDPTASATHVVLSALSRLGSKDTLFRLGRMLLQPQVTSSMTSTAVTGAGRVPSVASATAVPRPVVPVGVDPRDTAPAAPPRVYLCGGNGFVFALSGFRFTFYGDVQQLTTAASNCVTDVLDLLLRQAGQRAAAQRYRSGDTSLGGQVWHPPASLQAAGLANRNDVVIAPAASLQLLPLYLVNFAVGAGAGLVWRERRALLAAARKVPGVRRVLAVVAPLPPPPLRLPDALQELTPECHILLIHRSGEVEVVGEDRAAPIFKNDRPAAAAAASTSPPSSLPVSASAEQRESGADAVCARVVAAQDLFCPIKRTLMCDPVQTVDGFTYDRDAIEEWLRVHDTAPLTNLHLDSVAVRVNWTARGQVETLMAQYAAAVQPQLA